MKLSELIKQDKFHSLAQEAILSVMVTNSWLTGELASTVSENDVTLVQYNVLRILRGSHPERLTCSEIGERMVDRTPDVTRLLDRLERSDLIERERAEHDRRVVEVRISKKGLDVLAGLDDQVDALEERLTSNLLDIELRELCDLLEKFRADQ